MNKLEQYNRALKNNWTFYNADYVLSSCFGTFLKVPGVPTPVNTPSRDNPHESYTYIKLARLGICGKAGAQPNEGNTWQPFYCNQNTPSALKPAQRTWTLTPLAYESNTTWTLLAFPIQHPSVHPLEMHSVPVCTCKGEGCLILSITSVKFHVLLVLKRCS